MRVDTRTYLVYYNKFVRILSNVSSTLEICYISSFEAEYYIIYIIDRISRDIIILRNGGYFWVAISAKFPQGIRFADNKIRKEGKCHSVVKLSSLYSLMPLQI